MRRRNQLCLSQRAERRAGVKLTCEGENRREDDMNSSTVDVKHDPEVDGNAAQDGEAIHEGPERCVQRDLFNEKMFRQLHRFNKRAAQTPRHQAVNPPAG